MKKLIIITAPSGSGKSTIVSFLLQQLPQLSFSVSACTRSPRPNEVDGIHYLFISLQEFEEKIRQDAFAEYEMVYPGKYYGTLKSELEKVWLDNKIPIVDIDVQGAIRLQKLYGKNALSLFIKTPSLEALKQRLIARGTETEDSLKVRLDKAVYELSFAEQFDYQIINDQLENACQETLAHVTEFLMTKSV